MRRRFQLNRHTHSGVGDDPARVAGTVLPPGSRPIGGGLVILAAAMLWPGVPAVTGMALAALGATEATIARFRRTDCLLPHLLLHTAVYGGLYIVFVGAALHSFALRHGTFHSVAALADIGLSVVPVGLALERMWHELGAGHAHE